MIQHPGVLALLLASGLVTLLVVAAAGLGWQILRHWDQRSGTESQLALERRTYLVSALLSLALGVQVLSLFLFIFTADGLHSQFVGAMCAAGSLAAAPFGYTTLLMKVGTCLLAGAWIVLHRADIRAYDCPLIRPKFALLLGLAPLVLAETWFQTRYLTGLRADVMTSCCGSLFGQGREGIAAELAGLPPALVHPLFWGSLLAFALAGAWFLRTRRGPLVFAILGLAFFVAALVALVSVFGLYIYELPTHHCPFCLLHREHGFVGYPLYATLLGGALAALGVGVLAPFRNRSSLAPVLPAMQVRLAWTALACAAVFTLIVGIWALVSPLRL